MLKNHIVVAFRNFAKHKLFTFINVAGLSIGITAAIVLYLFADYQLSYDQFHSKSDRIYLVYKERITPTGIQPTYDTWVPMLKEFKNDFPEVENGVRIFQSTALVEVNNSRFSETCYYADPDYFSVFDFPLASGKRPGADEQAVVISQNLATKYFGKANPVGQVIKIDFNREYTVAGVMEEYPQNGFVSAELIIPIRTFSQYADSENDWGSGGILTYILLKEGSDATLLTSKFPSFITKIWDEEVQKRTNFKLLPLSATFETFIGDPNDVYILLLVGVGLILIVTINFVNLSTARSLDRSKEVSMRKVFGAHKSQLIRQFLHESVLLSVAGLLLALGMARLIIPLINQKFTLDLQINYFDPLTIGSLLAFSLALGFVAGIFPSFILSGLQIQRGLKSIGGRKTYLRNALVTVQFALSIALIITMTVIGNQISFMKKADMGFQSENQIIIPISVFDFANADEAVTRLQTFKDVIRKHSAVQSLSSSRHIPTQWTGSNVFVRPEGWQDSPLRMAFTYHDADFLKTYDIPLLQGPGFLDDSYGDQRESVILNESALRAFGWNDIENKNIMIGDRLIKVVGVIKNFNFESLQQEVAPILHFHRTASNQTHRYITVNVTNGNGPQVIDFVKSNWTLLDEEGALPFNYFYLQDNISTMYQAEDRLFSMIRGFAVVVLLIACMGLFGLSSFTMEKKKKEIGIRKVLGASVSGIVSLFFKRYVNLLIISFLVAAPVAWYFMSKWLTGYANHTTIGIGTFVTGFGAIVLVALGSVSFKTIQMALRNPASIIKEE